MLDVLFEHLLLLFQVYFYIYLYQLLQRLLKLIQEEIVRWLLAKTVVVATDIWAVKEITDKEDLILVKAWDISSLFDGLWLAVNSIDKSWLSYDEVKEKFSWNNRIKEYLSICYP